MYRWVEHTAEVELEIDAATPSEVFAEALAAYAELSDGPGGEPARRELALEATDLPALLADWLNALIALGDVEGFVPGALESFELRGPALSATVDGQLGEPRPLVKAATYHGLALEPHAGRWRARVVLDV